MKKFKATVTRTDEYHIEIDENVWDKEQLKEWGSAFSNVDSVQDLSEYLVLSIIREGHESFIEGFGYVKTFRKDGSQHKKFGIGFKEISEDDYTKGIKVTILSEDDDYEVEFDK
jgi:hypothetical protein